MNERDLHEQHPFPGGFDTADQVHVWQVSLEISATQTENLSGILSEDELIRAGRFHFAQDKKRFIAARGFLRQILSDYLGKDPRLLRFGYTTYGKPLLVSDTATDPLQFNLSHTGMTALYAISPGQHIGIDIERIRDDLSLDQIANRYFSPAEINVLEKADEEERSSLFFKYWTRKEALLKARGEGLSFPMEKIDVSFINRSSPARVTVPGPENIQSSWYLQDLCAGTGFAAAIAVEERCGEIKYLHYST